MTDQNDYIYMDILEKFGVDPILLVAQIVNFLIIFFILKKFLYKSVLDLLKKRQNKIKEGLEQAEEARIRLDKVVIEEKNILSNAHLQGKKLIEDAKKESLEMMQKAKFEAKIQATNILHEARLQINSEAKETEKRLASNINSLAIELIRRSSSELFGKQEQELVMKNVLSKFKKKTN